MPYVAGFDRKQMMMYSWDMLVDEKSIARLIDAFVNSLDMTKYTEKEVSLEGRPSYDPRSLYKLYIYGHRKGIRSSRKLAEACRVNVEAKWLVGGVEPDFRTISDFRKNNIDSMKKIFHEFNRRISGAVEWGFTSIDGSKFQADNSKNTNFTMNKLDDRIRWLNAHTDEYLRILKDMDEQEDIGEEPEGLTREVVEEKLKEARERLERYEGYRKIMEETGASQMSLTDADSKLMKSKNGFAVGYNPQTAVDSNTHLIRDFNMTNQVTDHGQLMPTMSGIREGNEDGVLEVVADKGYQKEEDLIECLENGIIPHVITEDGKDGYELEVRYEESEADAASTKPEEIKKTLHAGKIPEAYKDVITEIEVKEVRRMVKEETDGAGKPESIYGTQEEMMGRAKEGYFVRDPERNLVYCPAGEVLRQKSIKKNGDIRYCNKNACKHCRYRSQCYKGKSDWKEIDFTKDCLEKPCKTWPKINEAEEGPETADMDGEAAKAEQGDGDPEQTSGKAGCAARDKRRYEKVKIVRLVLKPGIEKTAERMCLSEHPFGTIKRAMGSSYFLLRGMRKVAGEFALFCLGYNIERAKNLLGFDKMMELMAVR